MKTEVLQSMKFDNKKNAIKYSTNLKKDKSKFSNVTVSTQKNVYGYYTVSYFELMEV